MKNLFKLFRIIALVAVIGFGVMACIVTDYDDHNEPKVYGEYYFPENIAGTVNSGILWEKDGGATKLRLLNFSQHYETGDEWQSSRIIFDDNNNHGIGIDKSTYIVGLNTNEYTCSTAPVKINFYAVRGWDGKLTISGFTFPYNGINLSNYNGVYTKSTP